MRKVAELETLLAGCSLPRVRALLGFSVPAGGPMRLCLWCARRVQQVCTWAAAGHTSLHNPKKKNPFVADSLTSSLLHTTLVSQRHGSVAAQQAHE